MLFCCLLHLYFSTNSVVAAMFHTVLFVTFAVIWLTLPSCDVAGDVEVFFGLLPANQGSITATLCPAQHTAGVAACLCIAFT